MHRNIPFSSQLTHCMESLQFLANGCGSGDSVFQGGFNPGPLGGMLGLRQLQLQL